MGLASRARQIWSKNRKREPLPGEPLTRIKKFFLNRTTKSSRICKAFEQLSSYCGWRVITKKPRANILALVGVKGFLHEPFSLVTFHHHNLPVDWARKLFKPSKDVDRLALSVLKKWEVLNFEFFVGNIINTGRFRPFLDHFIWPWAPIPREKFVSFSLIKLVKNLHCHSHWLAF